MYLYSNTLSRCEYFNTTLYQTMQLAENLIAPSRPTMLITKKKKKGGGGGGGGNEIEASISMQLFNAAYAKGIKMSERL